MWAAIDATLTIAEPSAAVPWKISLTLSVPMRIGPHDVLGITHAGAHARGVDHRAEGSEAGCGLEQSGDRLSLGDIAIHDRCRDSEVLQRGGGGIEPVLPDVCENDRVVLADDLGSGLTHAARAARDHRYSTHDWTVYAQFTRYMHGWGVMASSGLQSKSSSPDLAHNSRFAVVAAG